MLFHLFPTGQRSDCFPAICIASAIAIFISFGSGCASHGTLQPHQAFRQSVTPSQAYFQGGQAGSGTTSNPFDTGTASDYVGYQGYNNGLPGLNRPAVTNSGFNANTYPASPAGSFSRQSPATGSYGNYVPAASYNYQPAYSGGFSSGSC